MSHVVPACLRVQHIAEEIRFGDVNAKFTPHSPSRTTPTMHCTALNCTHSQEAINPGVMYIRHLSLARHYTPRPGDIATSTHAASIVATAGVYKPPVENAEAGLGRRCSLRRLASKCCAQTYTPQHTHTRARSHYADGSQNRRSSSEMADRSG